MEPRDLCFRFPLMRGEDVRAVQQALTVIQTRPPCGTVDGIFGNATRLAVEAFQRSSPGLGVDGVVGRRTREALFREAEKRLPKPQAGVPAQAPLVRAGATQGPLSRAQALRAQDWLMREFGGAMIAATQGTPFDPPLLCAIAAKETGPEWLRWIGRIPTEQIIARCVFDASGDFPGTSRRAFPPNTAAFRARFGDAVARDFIAEANETRRLRDFSPAEWVYKGYGIFQYDLQHIERDPDFFLKKLWRDFGQCLDRCMRELRTKFEASSGDLRETVRRYNGSGERAETYADHVLQMYGWMR